MKFASTLLGVWALLSVGCAGHSPLLPSYALQDKGLASVELTQTPFFSQTAYQCGPAALATVLHTVDIPVAPQALASKVYVPEKKGSFQAELITAARRYGRIPYPITPTFSALLRELQGGRPVLVLQNLGLDSYPVWHYAVVIGFDVQGDQIILRSGSEAREITKTRKFLKTWQRAGNWGLVILRPGEMPAAPERNTYLQEIAALEAMGQDRAALESYRAALQRWPDHLVAMLGLGNSYYALGQLDEAEAAYRGLLDIAPENTIALNNLAQVLADKGHHQAALVMVDAALCNSDPNAEFRPAVLRTRANIIARYFKPALYSLDCETASVR